MIVSLHHVYIMESYRYAMLSDAYIGLASKLPRFGSGSWIFLAISIHSLPTYNLYKTSIGSKLTTTTTKITICTEIGNYDFSMENVSSSVWIINQLSLRQKTKKETLFIRHTENHCNQDWLICINQTSN